MGSFGSPVAAGVPRSGSGGSAAGEVVVVVVPGLRCACPFLGPASIEAPAMKSHGASICPLNSYGGDVCPNLSRATCGYVASSRPPLRQTSTPRLGKTTVSQLQVPLSSAPPFQGKDAANELSPFFLFFFPQGCSAGVSPYTAPRCAPDKCGRQEAQHCTHHRGNSHGKGNQTEEK